VWLDYEINLEWWKWKKVKGKEKNLIRRERYKKKGNVKEKQIVKKEWEILERRKQKERKVIGNKNIHYI